jgi:hypothetical protein
LRGHIVKIAVRALSDVVEEMQYAGAIDDSLRLNSAIRDTQKFDAGVRCSRGRRSECTSKAKKQS